LKNLQEGYTAAILILTLEEVDELKTIVQELQAAGQHSALSGVFKSILE